MYSYMCGFESSSLAEVSRAVVGSPTIESAIVHGGKYALRCNPTAFKSYAEFQQLRNINTQPQPIFCSVRFYLYVASLPDKTTTIYTGIAGVIEFYQDLLLNPDGSLTIEDGAGATATTTVKLSTGQWHQISLLVNPVDGQNFISVSVDGSEAAQLNSSSGNTTVYDIVKIGAGITEDVTCDLYFDDILWDDGAALIGPGAQVLLLPTTDNSIAAWTGGAGGTTNLFEAVNHVPPTGAMPPGTNASQIRNPSSVVPSDYTATLESYNAAGIPTGATLNAVAAFVLEGLEQLAAIFGSVWLANNPTQAPPAQTGEFEFGAGIPIGSNESWNPDEGAVVSNPTVDLAVSPTVMLRKVTYALTTPPKHGVGSPIAVAAELLGAYVDFVA